MKKDCETEIREGVIVLNNHSFYDIDLKLLKCVKCGIKVERNVLYKIKGKDNIL